MQQTGLNRHRRVYATKEAGSAVHFPVSGPIGLARSQILNLPTSSSLIITSCTSAVLMSYFITTGTIALSIADGPILLIREHQGMKKKSILPHATRYQTIPINLMHNM